MKQSDPVIHSDPEIMGGTPVFIGTVAILGARVVQPELDRS